MYAELPLWYLTLLEITHSVILMILVEEKHRKKYENNESTEIKALPGSNIHIFRYSESITVKFLWVNRYMSFLLFIRKPLAAYLGKIFFRNTILFIILQTSNELETLLFFVRKTCFEENWVCAILSVEEWIVAPYSGQALFGIKSKFWIILRTCYNVNQNKFPLTLLFVSSQKFEIVHIDQFKRINIRGAWNWLNHRKTFEAGGVTTVISGVFSHFWIRWRYKL